MGIEIRVLKTLATEKAYLELLPRFEQASGHRVTTRYGGTVDVRNWLGASEPFDLTIAASAVIAPQAVASFRKFGLEPARR